MPITLAQKIRQEAEKLTDSEKAGLALELLGNLPPVLDDEDEGLAEARRRDQELERTPGMAVSWEQICHGIGR